MIKEKKEIRSDESLDRKAFWKGAGEVTMLSTCLLLAKKLAGWTGRQLQMVPMYKYWVILKINALCDWSTFPPCQTIVPPQVSTLFLPA